MQVKMKYTGTEKGPVQFRPGDRKYLGAADGFHGEIEADPEDVAALLSTGKWVLAEEQPAGAVTELRPIDPELPDLDAGEDIGEDAAEKLPSLQDLSAKDAVALISVYTAGIEFNPEVLELWLAEEEAEDGKQRKTVIEALKKKLE